MTPQNLFFIFLFFTSNFFPVDHSTKTEEEPTYADENITYACSDNIFDTKVKDPVLTDEQIKKNIADYKKNVDVKNPPPARRKVKLPELTDDFEEENGKSQRSNNSNHHEIHTLADDEYEKHFKTINPQEEYFVGTIFRFLDDANTLNISPLNDNFHTNFGATSQELQLKNITAEHPEYFDYFFNCTKLELKIIIKRAKFIIELNKNLKDKTKKRLLFWLDTLDQALISDDIIEQYKKLWGGSSDYLDSGLDAKDAKQLKELCDTSLQELLQNFKYENPAEIDIFDNQNKFSSRLLSIYLVNKNLTIVSLAKQFASHLNPEILNHFTQTTKKALLIFCEENKEIIKFDKKIAKTRVKLNFAIILPLIIADLTQSAKDETSFKDSKSFWQHLLNENSEHYQDLSITFEIIECACMNKKTFNKNVLYAEYRQNRSLIKVFYESILKLKKSYNLFKSDYEKIKLFLQQDPFKNNSLSTLTKSYEFTEQVRLQALEQKEKTLLNPELYKNLNTILSGTEKTFLLSDKILFYLSNLWKKSSLENDINQKKLFFFINNFVNPANENSLMLFSNDLKNGNPIGPILNGLLNAYNIKIYLQNENFYALKKSTLNNFHKPIFNAMAMTKTTSPSNLLDLFRNCDFSLPSNPILSEVSDSMAMTKTTSPPNPLDHLSIFLNTYPYFEYKNNKNMQFNSLSIYANAFLCEVEKNIDQNTQQFWRSCSILCLNPKLLPAEKLLLSLKTYFINNGEIDFPSLCEKDDLTQAIKFLSALENVCLANIKIKDDDECCFNKDYLKAIKNIAEKAKLEFEDRLKNCAA